MPGVGGAEPGPSQPRAGERTGVSVAPRDLILAGPKGGRGETLPRGKTAPTGAPGVTEGGVPPLRASLAPPGHREACPALSAPGRRWAPSLSSAHLRPTEEEGGPIISEHSSLSRYTVKQPL